MEYARDDHLFPLVREPASRWERSGLTPQQERRFNLTASILVGMFLIGWIYTFTIADRADLSGVPVATVSTRITENPLSPRAAPEAAFVMDEIVRGFAQNLAPYRGYSGEVNVVVQSPGEAAPLAGVADSLPGGAQVELQPGPGTVGAAAPAEHGPPTPGVWNVALRMRDAVRPMPDFSVIRTVPLSQRQGGRIGRYLLGSWPYERGGAPRPIYEPPKGVVQVTPENRNMKVSEHFVLGDFLTKGQENVWPKYVVLSTRLLDKLELTLQELESMGHPVENVFVISGFRTPVYNVSGGNPSGRGQLSRHMYGDAADIAIDNDGNGRMDDLNGDGRVTVADARIIANAAERVEKKYPNLIGGIGIYRPTGGHSGMVHIDTRGFRARW